MDRITDILIRFAKSRIRSLEAIKKCCQGHYDAAKRIERVAEYFSSKPSAVQIGCIRQIEGELKLLLPSETSRFKNLRIQILSLIDQCHQYYESMEKSPTT